jgi:hypothetical protein
MQQILFLMDMGCVSMNGKMKDILLLRSSRQVVGVPNSYIFLFLTTFGSHGQMYGDKHFIS